MNDYFIGDNENCVEFFENVIEIVCFIQNISFLYRNVSQIGSFCVGI